MWSIVNGVLNFQYVYEIAVTVVVLALRYLIQHWWLHKVLDSPDGQYEHLAQHRHRVGQVLNWGTTAVLLLVWFAQVQNVLLSFIAIAAALVVATKEVILCVMGGLYLRFSKAYSIKDRIEVHGIRGYVVEIGLTYTRVLEIGPERESQQTTGAIITMPNSLLLSNSIKNESYFGSYSIKSFTFHIPKSLTLEAVEAFLLSTANAVVAPYQEQAQREIVDFCKISGLALPSVNARIKVILSSNGEPALLLKIPIESHRIADVEQHLVRAYLAFIER